MEFIYHFILDNIIEIISILSSFKQALDISLTNKYQFNCIYYFPTFYIDTKTDFPMSKIYNFRKMKKLYLRDHDNKGVNYSRLQSLKELTIQHCTYYQYIPNIIDIKKLTSLTCLKLILPDVFRELKKYDNSPISTSIHFSHKYIRELTINFNYDYFVRSIAINCSNIAKLNLSMYSARFSPDLHLKRNSYQFLNHLSVKYVNIKFDESFINLTYLKICYIGTNNDRLVSLTNLTNLLYLSVEKNDVIIDNISTITKLKLDTLSNLNIEKLHNLQYLKITYLTFCQIIHVDRLRTIILHTENNISKEKLLQCFHSNKINHMKVGWFTYSQNLNQRLFELRHHRIAIDGEVELSKLIKITNLTHLILINTRKIKNVGGITSLRRLTIAHDTFLYDPRNIIISKLATKEYITVDEARTKYTTDIMKL